jgi:hypothetical protein
VTAAVLSAAMVVGLVGIGVVLCLVMVSMISLGPRGIGRSVVGGMRSCVGPSLLVGPLKWSQSF